MCGIRVAGIPFDREPCRTAARDSLVPVPYRKQSGDFPGSFNSPYARVCSLGSSTGISFKSVTCGQAGRVHQTPPRPAAKLDI